MKFIKKISLLPFIKPVTKLAFLLCKRITSAYSDVFQPLNARLSEEACFLLSEKFGLSRSILLCSSVDSEGREIPWYTYPAIEFLEQIDFSKSKIWEYGSGNSSVWWSRHARHVDSVESDRQWYLHGKDRLMENSCIFFAESADEYANKINGTYDVIVIDGKWRDLCAPKALEHIADDGLIIIDDSQRVQSAEEYQDAMAVLQRDRRFIEIDFPGFTPIANFTKITTFFISRKAALSRKGERYPEYSTGNLINEP